MQLYQWTVSVALLLLALEIALPSFFFAGLAIGAGCVALLHFLTDGIAMARDLTVFAIGSAIGFAALRSIHSRWAKGTSDINRY